MALFAKKKKAGLFPYDPARHQAVLRCSICTGEQTAGFRDRETGEFHELSLIRSDEELKAFMKAYRLDSVEKIY